MSMKKVVNGVTENFMDDYSTADVINRAGGRAWSMPDEERLRQIMFVGTMGNTFYASNKEIIKESVDFLNKMIDTDPAKVGKMMVQGRNEGYIRTAPILGLVLLAVRMKEIHEINSKPQRDHKVLVHVEHCADVFRNNFNLIIRTGNDLEDFMNLLESTGRKYGSGIKKTINRWLDEKLTPYYAIKYTKQIGRAIRVSRPVSKSTLYDYVLKFTKGESSRFDKSLEDYPQLGANEEVKSLLENHQWKKASSLIEKHRLDPMTLTGKKDIPAQVWKSLSDQMGVMMYLKMLNKILRAGAFDAEILNKKITVSNLKKAKVFPFRLYTAYENVVKSNHARSGTVANYLADVLNDYVQEYDWEIWNKSFAILPDVSGSMTLHVGNSTVVPSVVSGMFTGILYKGLKDSVVIPWDTKVNLGIVHPRSDSVITHINSIRECHGGGTRMEVPLLYLRDSKIKRDICVFITDSMEWGTGWLTEWQHYRREVNRKAKAVLIRVDSYNSNPFSQEIAQKHGIYQIFGWNDSVLSYIEQVVLK